MGTVEIDSRVILRRELNLHHLISIGIGGLIGSGIFVSPVGILIHAGSIGASLFVWMFCAICQFLFAICYAELGSRFPLSGSDYIYLNEIYGELTACIRLWSALLAFLLGQSVFNDLFATYLIKPVYMHCDIPVYIIKMFYFVGVGFVTFCNCYSVQLVAKLQVFFSITKLIALSLVIALGFFHMINGDIGQLNEPFLDTTQSPASFALAFYSGVWALSGWEHLCCVVGEIKHPKRDLRLALMTSISITTVVYILANIAYAAVLSKEEMLLSPAVAVAFGRKTMREMSWAMPLFVALSVLGSSLGSYLANSRMFFMGSKHGHLPEIFTLISIERRTPMVCLLAMGVLALIGNIWNNVLYLMELLGFIQVIFQALCMIGLIKLRHIDKNIQCSDVVSAPLAVPEICLFIQLLLLLMTIYQRPLESVVVVIIHVVVFTFIYIACVQWKGKPESFYKLKECFTVLLQKVFVVTPEEQ